MDRTSAVTGGDGAMLAKVYRERFRRKAGERGGPYPCITFCGDACGGLTATGRLATLTGARRMIKKLYVLLPLNTVCRLLTPKPAPTSKPATSARLAGSGTTSERIFTALAMSGNHA